MKQFITMGSSATVILLFCLANSEGFLERQRNVQDRNFFGNTWRTSYEKLHDREDKLDNYRRSWALDNTRKDSRTRIDQSSDNRDDSRMSRQLQNDHRRFSIARQYDDRRYSRFSGNHDSAFFDRERRDQRVNSLERDDFRRSFSRTTYRNVRDLLLDRNDDRRSLIKSNKRTNDRRNVNMERSRITPDRRYIVRSFERDVIRNNDRRSSTQDLANNNRDVWRRQQDQERTKVRDTERNDRRSLTMSVQRKDERLSGRYNIQMSRNRQINDVRLFESEENRNLPIREQRTRQMTAERVDARTQFDRSTSKNRRTKQFDHRDNFGRQQMINRKGREIRENSRRSMVRDDRNARHKEIRIMISRANNENDRRVSDSTRRISIKDQNNNGNLKRQSVLIDKTAFKSDIEYKSSINFNALLNAVQIALLTLLAVQIVNNSSKVKKNWFMDFVTATKEKVL